jgi:hypothetical protein
VGLDTVEGLLALHAWLKVYNEQCLIERHGHPSVDTSNPATRGRVKSGHHGGVASETG